MFKVAIVGGEGMSDYDKFCNKCKTFLKNKAKEGITIYTTGNDFVYSFARRYGIVTQFFITDWATYGRDALKKRNEKMLDNCDALIVFEDGIKDTRMIYNLAMQKGIPCRRVL